MKIRPVSEALILLIRFYQKAVSPRKISCCRFTPTCSAYAIQALKTHGFFIGFPLIVRRILRCNPFCKGGYDPVPPKKHQPFGKVKTDDKII